MLSLAVGARLASCPADWCWRVATHLVFPLRPHSSRLSLHSPSTCRLPPAMRPLLDRSQAVLLLLADLLSVVRLQGSALLPLLRACAVSLSVEGQKLLQEKATRLLVAAFHHYPNQVRGGEPGEAGKGSGGKAACMCGWVRCCGVIACSLPPLPSSPPFPLHFPSLHPFSLPPAVGHNPGRALLPCGALRGRRPPPAPRLPCLRGRAHLHTDADGGGAADDTGGLLSWVAGLGCM